MPSAFSGIALGGGHDWYGVASGTNTYTVTTGSPGLRTGAVYVIRFTNGNTGAATLNPDSLGAVSLLLDGNALAGGELKSGSTWAMVYNGTAFDLIGDIGGASEWKTLFKDDGTSLTDWNQASGTWTVSAVPGGGNYLTCDGATSTWNRLYRAPGGSTLQDFSLLDGTDLDIELEMYIFSTGGAYSGTGQRIGTLHNNGSGSSGVFVGDLFSNNTPSSGSTYGENFALSGYVGNPISVTQDAWVPYRWRFPISVDSGLMHRFSGQNGYLQGNNPTSLTNMGVTTASYLSKVNFALANYQCKAAFRNIEYKIRVWGQA